MLVTLSCSNSRTIPRGNQKKIVIAKVVFKTKNGHIDGIFKKNLASKNSISLYKIFI